VCAECLDEERALFGDVRKARSGVEELRAARRLIIELHARVRTVWTGSEEYQASELADRVRAFLRRR